MKILIKKNAYLFASHRTPQSFTDAIKKLEGKWVEVEIEHLFNNQYNTKELRIYDSMVEAVKDDARINKGKCGYCGTMLNRGEVCTKHAECSNYSIEWFTPENTYFLKYPDGVKVYPHQFLSIDAFNIKIGSYHLECFPSLDYFRLSNCRQTINFKYDGELFYIHGIGYKETRNLPIPKNVQNDLKHKLYALNEKMEKEKGKGFFKI